MTIDEIKAHGADLTERLSKLSNYLHVEETLAQIAERPGHESVLVCSHGGIAINFYMLWKAYAQVPLTIFSNVLTYVYEYEDGVFSCTDLFVPDLSSLEIPGLPPQMRKLGKDVSNPWEAYYNGRPPA